MPEVSFERPMRADPTRVLQRAEKWLVAQGYQVSARSQLELSLVGLGVGGRHRLCVSADGQSVRFVFAPGALGGELPDAVELERRVEGALAELGPTPAEAQVSPGGATRRCSICATAMEASARACPMCGLTQ